MYYCKDFKSLSVLSLYEGELLGTVNQLLFDKKLKKLCELELLGCEGVKLSLSTKNIYNVGKNAITVKNNQAVDLKESEHDFCIAPIGSKVYSIKGEFLGVVQEITVGDKFTTEKVSLDSGETLEIRDLATCGKNTLIFYNDDSKPKIKRFTPKQPKVYKKADIQIAKTQPVTETEALQTVEVKIPICQNSNFLIGRVCTKDIFNFNNELLIKAHSVINKKNLKEINKFGKLRELMLYSK